jgi:prepilin-type N-terminal cleavage/methylation domain-containing protein
MKSVFQNRDERGFSLVELMIVVGIIGVLATLALPRFKLFQAKAKMGEAKNMLSHIYTLEQSYFLESNDFVGWAALVGRQEDGSIANCNTLPTEAQQIGFRIDPCADGTQTSAPTPRYGYMVTNATPTTFLGFAASGADDGNVTCPGNPAHVFTIDEQNRMGGAGLGVKVALGPEPIVGSVCAN